MCAWHTAHGARHPIPVNPFRTRGVEGVAREEDGADKEQAEGEGDRLGGWPAKFWVQVFGDVEPRVVVGGVVGVVDALIPARMSLHLVCA